MECKYGIFIFNSTTNSFLKISRSVLEKIEGIKDKNLIAEDLSGEMKKIFITNHILVPDDFDEKYLAKLKFIHQRSAFDARRLLLTIATTTDCNFKCPYCYEEGITGERMDENTEKAIVTYIDTIKPRKLDIGWYGGEPLLNFGSIKRLTDEISKLSYIDDLQYSIVTNGSLLTEDVCHFFRNNHLKNAQITLDGLEEHHNRSRIAKSGEATYTLILSNLDKAMEMLPECHFSIRVNISAVNGKDYPLLYRELHERYRDRSNFSIYFGFIEDYNMCGSSNVLKSRERIEFLRDLEQKHHIYDKIYPVREDCLCTACLINSFVIAPQGDLYKCWNDIGRKNLVIGNVNDKKMIGNHDLLCEYAINHNKFADPRCLECFMFPVCSGGCPNNRLNNQYMHSKFDICPYNLAHIDATLELMYERIFTLSQQARAIIKSN